MSEELAHVPKVIHYCWFGGKPLPELALKCIESWKKYCPEFEIREWNESNFDLHSCEYVEEAYQSKRWAFVSDFARFKILYEYGGVYFDTDVELIKSIDDILLQEAFMAGEHLFSIGEDKINVNPGLGLASIPGHPLYKEIIESYQTSHYLMPDGTEDITTVVVRVTNILKKYGFTGNNVLHRIKNVCIYPSDYFCPLNYHTGEMVITSNTRAIHHYMASWIAPARVKLLELERKARIGKRKDILFCKLASYPIKIKANYEEKGITGLFYAFVNKLKNRR